MFMPFAKPHSNVSFHFIVNFNSYKAYKPT